MRYACNCCGYKTFDESPNNTFLICHVCFWEDDGVQFSKPDYEGGANLVSLREAQRNFKLFGASEERFIKNVRKATPEELRDANWKPLP